MQIHDSFNMHVEHVNAFFVTLANYIFDLTILTHFMVTSDMAPILSGKETCKHKGPDCASVSDKGLIL